MTSHMEDTPELLSPSVANFSIHDEEIQPSTFKDRPMFRGYELIGDSNLKRFALQWAFPPPAGKVSEFRGNWGLATSGETVKRLLERVLAQGVHKKVIVCIGTNDLLRISKRDHPNPERDLSGLFTCYSVLKATLSRDCSHIIWLTTPPSPRCELGLSGKEDSKRYRELLQEVNTVIKNMANGQHLEVVDLEAYLRKDGQPDRSCFEEVMGSDKDVRVDGIHLNSKGFSVINNLLKTLLSSRDPRESPETAVKQNSSSSRPSPGSKPLSSPQPSSLSSGKMNSSAAPTPPPPSVRPTLPPESLSRSVRRSQDSSSQTNAHAIFDRVWRQNLKISFASRNKKRARDTVRDSTTPSPEKLSTDGDQQSSPIEALEKLSTDANQQSSPIEVLTVIESTPHILVE